MSHHRVSRTAGGVLAVYERVGSMRNDAAWKALRQPVTVTEAAKLLGMKFRDLEAMIDGFTLLTITVRRRRLVPLSELWQIREQYLQRISPKRSSRHNH